MQKMFNANRDVIGSTEILGSPGTLAKIGEGLKRSFTTDALKKVSDIDSILTGSQEEVINKLQGAFNIDPRLVESLSDFKFSEFIEVMEQLKEDVRDIKDTQQLMEKISELRKEENERLKEFRDAAKEAGDQYVDFTNKLRATGEALSSTLSNSMKVRSASGQANREVAFKRGQGIINNTPGLSPENKALAEFQLGQSKRLGDLRGKTEGESNKAIKSSFDIITKSFIDSLEKTDDPKRANEVNERNTNLRANFNKEAAESIRKIASLDPVQQREEVQKQITALAQKIGDPNKQSSLLAQLNKISTDSNGALALLGVENKKTNDLAAAQLVEQKKAAKNASNMKLMGGVESFLDPTKRTADFKDFNQGLNLMELGSGRRGRSALNARSRGGLQAAMSAQKMGLLDVGKDSQIFRDVALPGMMENMRSSGSALLARTKVSRERVRRRGGDTSAADQLIKSISEKLRPENLREAATAQLDTALQTADPAKVQLRLAGATETLTKGTNGLNDTITTLINSFESGEALDEGIKGQQDAAKQATTAQDKLTKSQDTLVEQQKISQDKLRNSVDRLKVAMDQARLDKTKSRLTEGQGGDAFNEFIARNDTMMPFDQPSAEQFLAEVDSMIKKTDHATTSFS